MKFFHTGKQIKKLLFNKYKCINVTQRFFSVCRLTWLPVVEDEDEAPHVYEYLCDLIEANHAVVLGTNNAHLPRLISFFAEALFREAVPTDHPVMSRILSIVREIQVCGQKSLLTFIIAVFE